MPTIQHFPSHRLMRPQLTASVSVRPIVADLVVAAWNGAYQTFGAFDDEWSIDTPTRYA